MSIALIVYWSSVACITSAVYVISNHACVYETQSHQQALGSIYIDSFS